MEYGACLSQLINLTPSFTVNHEEEPYILGCQEKIQPEYHTLVDEPSSCNIITISSGQDIRRKSIPLFRELQKGRHRTSYFSFSSTDRRRNSIMAFMSSVAFQVMNQDPQSFERVRGLYKSMNNSHAWSKSALAVLFQSIMNAISDSNPIFIIIDELHKCDSPIELLDICSRLLGNEQETSRIKLAIFYEAHTGIKGALERIDQFRMHFPGSADKCRWHDVRMLSSIALNNRIELSPLRFSTLQALRKCEDETSLLHGIQSLRPSPTMPRTKKSFEKLAESLPLTMEDVVFHYLGRLENWARTSLGWILNSKRPLSLNELAIAVAVTNDVAGFAGPIDEDSLPLDFASDVQRAFGTLLTMETGGISFNSDHILRCCREFVKRDRQAQQSREGVGSGNEIDAKAIIPANTEITLILLEYLSSEEYTDLIGEAIQIEPCIQLANAASHLTVYAARYWAIHFHESERVHSFDKRVAEIINSTPLFRLLPRPVRGFDKASYPPDVYAVDPLYLAAQYGLTSIIQNFVNGINVEKWRLAVNLASRGGHYDIVRILLEIELDEEGDRDLSLALENASVSNHESVIDLLLNHMEVEKTLSVSLLDTLLCQAADLGYEAQTCQLLESSARVNAALDGLGPLRRAASNGHAYIIRVLLGKLGFVADNSENAPIALAAANGHDYVIQHLLPFYQDVDVTRDDGFRVAIEQAAKSGYKPSLELLLGRLGNGATPSSNDEGASKGAFLGPILIQACMRGHDEVARLLLQHGADVTAIDDNKCSALYYALSYGGGRESLASTLLDSVESIEELFDFKSTFLQATRLGLTNILEKCINLLRAAGRSEYWQYTDDHGRTPIHLAAAAGHDETVLLFIRHDAEIDGIEPEDNCTPLVLAAASGHWKTVQVLLDNDANLKVTVGNRKTILTYIAEAEVRSGQAAAIRLLLEQKLNPNLKDGNGLTALMAASTKGNLDVIRVLLEFRANPEITYLWGWSAIHFAARNASPVARTMCELLIKAGSDPLQTDTDDWLPFHLASGWGNTEVLDLLIEYGQDTLNARANDGRTPLHFGFRNPESLRWLLNRGAGVDAVDHQSVTTLMIAAAQRELEPIHLLLEYNARVDLGDSNGQTALHRAAKAGNCAIGRELLDKDPGVLHCKDTNDCSALHIAITNGSEGFAEMLLDEFYNKGHSLDDLSQPRRDTNSTPLISAVEHDQLRVAQKLVKLGASTEARDDSRKTALLWVFEKKESECLNWLESLLKSTSGSRINVNAGENKCPTALHEAAKKGWEDVVELLLNNGANINEQGGQFNTALTAAAANGWVGIADDLLDRNADPHLPGGDFANALSAAVYSESEDLVWRLIAKTVDTNATDGQGRTAILIASARGNITIMDALIAAKGDISVKDTQGRTVLHYGATSGNQELMEFLLENESVTAEVTTEDGDGWKPIHWACLSDRNTEIIETLLSQNCDSAKPAGDRGWTLGAIARSQNAYTILQQVDSKGPAWKVGEPQRGIVCDGCFLFVSPLLLHGIPSPHHR